MTENSTTTNTASAMSAIRSLNPVDPEALVNTFRNDAMSEDIQRIIRQEVEVADLPITQELESMRIESRNVHLTTQFETDREQEQSEFIVNSVDAWIDTAVDSLEIVAQTGIIGMKNFQPIVSFFILFLASMLGCFFNTDGVPPSLRRALEHGRRLFERSLSIYSRSIRQAFNGVAFLHAEITRNINTRNNPTVHEAMTAYEKRRLKYDNGEIDIKKLAEAHSQLVKEVEEAESDETTDVRKAAKKSRNLLEVALIIAAIVVALLIGSRA